MKILRVGHSPDPDDAFMFYGIAKGKVRMPGFKVRHVIKDIQSLNMLALKKKLEVTAISAAVYPFAAKNYRILACGASVGRNYGPIIVTKAPRALKSLQGKRIAVPGLQTTAYMLLKIFLGDFKPVVMDFTKIIPAVQRGKVDAGLVIHEGQMTYASFGLHKVADLGKLWHKKYKLPIPLGLDVVRKDLGPKLCKETYRVLLESIECARANQSDSLKYAMKFGRGVDAVTAGKFVNMYVNEDTAEMGREGESALKILFREGARLGLCPKVTKLDIVR